MISKITSQPQLNSSSTSSTSSSSATIAINETSLPCYISQLQTNACACYGNLDSSPNLCLESFHPTVECGKHAKLTPKTLPKTLYSIIFDYLDLDTLQACTQVEKWDELIWDSFDITRLYPLGLTIFDANDWKKILNPRYPRSYGLHFDDQVSVNNRILIPMLIKLLKHRQIGNHGITLITMPRGLTIYHLYHLAYKAKIRIQHYGDDFSTLNREVLKTTYFMAITDHAFPVTANSYFREAREYLKKQDNPYPAPNDPFFQEISSVIQKNFDIERDQITDLLLWEKLLAARGFAIPSLLELIAAHVIQFHQRTYSFYWKVGFFTSSAEQHLVSFPNVFSKDVSIEPHRQNKVLLAYMKGVHRFNPPDV